MPFQAVPATSAYERPLSTIGISTRCKQLSVALHSSAGSHSQSRFTTIPVTALSTMHIVMPPYRSTKFPIDGSSTAAVKWIRPNNEPAMIGLMPNLIVSMLDTKKNVGYMAEYYTITALDSSQNERGYVEISFMIFMQQFSSGLLITDESV